MDNKWWLALVVAMAVMLVEALFSIYTQLTLDNAQNAEDKRYNMQIEINTKDIAILKEKVKTK